MITKCFILIALSLTALLLSCSRTGVNSTSQPTPTTIERETFRGKGVIKSIDIDTDRVTVDHVEIPGFRTATGVMNEMVSDHEVLGGIKVGDMVEFELIKAGSKVFYTQFIKVGEASNANVSSPKGKK